MIIDTASNRDFIATNTGGVNFRPGPKYVGAWTIGGQYGLRIAQERKPRRLTRFLCRVLLEWQWEDV